MPRELHVQSCMRIKEIGMRRMPARSSKGALKEQLHADSFCLVLCWHDVV